MSGNIVHSSFTASTGSRCRNPPRGSSLHVRPPPPRASFSAGYEATGCTDSTCTRAVTGVIVAVQYEERKASSQTVWPLKLCTLASVHEAGRRLLVCTCLLMPLSRSAAQWAGVGLSGQRGSFFRSSPAGGSSVISSVPASPALLYSTLPTSMVGPSSVIMMKPPDILHPSSFLSCFQRGSARWRIEHSSGYTICLTCEPLCWKLMFNSWVSFPFSW